MTTNYQSGTRISEYILEERIGGGAFGEVWRARHHVWEREQVAVKLPTDADYVRHLQREGVVVHGLRHPNIVGVRGLDPYAEIPYLIMELVRGPSLRQTLTEHPKGVSLDTALTVLRGMLTGISIAHAANVLHRDLKPGNVLLDLDGKPLDALEANMVKLTDFGLGLAGTDVLRSIAQSASLERDNRLVGTLAYMAPELRDGKRKADPRSDLYSVGVILFEMLTGERPAGAELPSTIRPEVPEALDDIFRRLYARHDRRYESADDVLEELQDRLLGRPAAGPPPPPGAMPLPPIPRAGERGRCKACGGSVETYDQFCTHCGCQLVGQIRRCAACGAFPGPHDRYCIFCGHRLSQPVE
jgi:serine/threonine protein kinase